MADKAPGYEKSNMTNRVELDVPSHSVQPEKLIQIHLRVPHTDYYIPIMINGTFEKEEPRLQRLGNGAVRMSMRQPFGFMTGITDYREYSQKTENMVIMPSEEPNEWRVLFETPEPSTEKDHELYRRGLDVYASFAAGAIAKNSKQ